MGKNISRKHFISASLGAAACWPLAGTVLGSAFTGSKIDVTKRIAASDGLKICFFSKHLQWLNYNDMAILAAQMGFDGIDLTVRPNGHVLPENVAKDLPKAVEAAGKAGIKIYTLTTNIKETGERYTESIIKTAASLGIKHYRTGWFDYDESLSIPENIRLVKNKLIGLEKINRQYGIYGDYENHAGEYFGASFWDLWLALKDIPNNFIGVQYDIRHATVEGANSWKRGFELLKNNIRTITAKDFYWEKKDSGWRIKDVMIGDGMVDFDQYFQLIKKNKISGPLIMHCEYPLGGAENGDKELSISKAEFVDTVTTDLSKLKRLLQNASLI